jgi:hypothetical protein
MNIPELIRWHEDKARDYSQNHATITAHRETVAALRNVVARKETTPYGDGIVFENLGDAEAQFIQDGMRLNCPACGGSGHKDDARQYPLIDDANDLISEILHKLNSWSEAYPTDIFPDPTPEHIQQVNSIYPSAVTRISARVGRHMVRIVKRDLDALTAALTALRNGASHE